MYELSWLSDQFSVLVSPYNFHVAGFFLHLIPPFYSDDELDYFPFFLLLQEWLFSARQL